MVFTSTPPLLFIEAHVQGTDALLETLPSLKLTYDLDLSAMNIGFHTVPVQEDCLKLPRGISIVTISPSRIDFRLDEETEKAFPVKIICHGDPASGYVLADTFAKPAIVMLKGPKYLIEDIQYISTRSIDVTGVFESFKKEITLDLIPYTQMVPRPSPIIAFCSSVSFSLAIYSSVGGSWRARKRVSPSNFDVASSVSIGKSPAMSASSSRVRTL